MKRLCSVLVVLLFLCNSGYGWFGSRLNQKSSVIITVAASDSDKSVRASADYVCDGTADNVQIQAAVDALPAMGGTIYFPAGNYYIADDILYNGRTMFKGDGPFASKLIASADDVTMFNWRGGQGGTEFFCSWIDLYLYGDADHRTGTAGIKTATVSTYNLADSRIVRCYIDEFNGNGVEIGNVWGWVISNAVIEHNRGFGVLAQAGGNLTISDCKLSANRDTNSGITAGVKLQSDWNLITNTQFELNGNNGLLLSSSDENVISNCTFRGNGEDGPNGSYPNNQTNGIELSNCNRTTISNCFFDGWNSQESEYSQDYGILIWSNCKDTKVSNCQFVDNAEAEIVEYQYSNKPLLTTYTEQRVERFVDVKQEDVDDLHAAEAGSGASKVVSTAITQPDVPRNVTITCTNNASPSGTVVIKGTNNLGRVHYENITITAGGTATGVDAFATIESYTIPATVAAGDTVSLGTGTRLGLSNEFFSAADVFKVNKNGSDLASFTAYPYVAVATQYNINCTVDVDAIDAGDTDDFTIWYKSELSNYN